MLRDHLVPGPLGIWYLAAVGHSEKKNVLQKESSNIPLLFGLKDNLAMFQNNWPFRQNKAEKKFYFENLMTFQ